VTELEIRPYQPGDEQEILTSFNQVFREVCGEGYVDRKMDFWKWEFEQNPQGMRVMLAVTPEGRVAAQYAGVPLAMHTFSGPTNFVHAVDSMVHPDFRQGLKKPGLFLTIGKAWFDHLGEMGIESVCFGYPVRPAWRIGTRYLGYVLIHVIDYLIAETPRLEEAATGSTDVDVEVRSDFPEDEINEFWEKWCRDKDCTVKKDHTYLHWRYVMHPTTEYIVLLARKKGMLVGVAVLHPAHELVPSALTFAEWMVFPGKEGGAVALTNEALRIAKERKRERLMTVLAPWSEDFAFFLERGFKKVSSVEYLQRNLGSYLWKEVFTSAWLAEHWTFSLGDSDLV
jgi:hypothetical protein